MTKHTAVTRLGCLVLAGLWTAAAAAGTGTTAPDYYRRARHAQTAEKQLELLSAALAINPDHIPSLRRRADLHVLLGDERAALPFRTRAANLAPHDVPLNISAGLLAQNLGEYERASAFYDRALAVQPANVQARSNRAQIRLRLGQVREAAMDAEELVRIAPERDGSYLIRLETHQAAGRFAEAAADATTLIDRSLDRPELYLRRSFLYQALGKGRDALADAEEVVRLRGPCPHAHANRGCCYQMLGELEKAFEGYQRAACLGGYRAYYHIWMALVRRRQGRPDEAGEIASQALENLDGDEWPAPVLRYLTGALTEDDLLRQAEHSNPRRQRERQCEVYYYLGAAALADDDLDRAEDLFNRCIGLEVHNFYEHAFALRDLRMIEERRKEEGQEEEQEEEQEAEDGDRGPEPE